MLRTREEIDRQDKGVKRTLVWLMVMLVVMVLFTIALIPLYQVFCDLLGINGKTSQEAFIGSDIIKVSDRQLDLQFITQIGTGLAVSFKPEMTQQRVYIGSKKTVDFSFKNLTNQPVVIRAIPSVSPAEASQYLLKIECFCFQELTLAANENQIIPLIYFVSAEIPEHLSKITLSYQLYPVDEPELAQPFSAQISIPSISPSTTKPATKHSTERPLVSNFSTHQSFITQYFSTQSGELL